MSTERGEGGEGGKKKGKNGEGTGVTVVVTFTRRRGEWKRDKAAGKKKKNRGDLQDSNKFLFMSSIMQSPFPPEKKKRR